MLPVLPQLSAKHQVIVAAVSDPRVEELAAGRSDAAQVYDAAAAERARNDRRAIASRLRRSGVDVVDAPPEELAPALADRYLAMKAAGQAVVRDESQSSYRSRVPRSSRNKLKPGQADHNRGDESITDEHERQQHRRAACNHPCRRHVYPSRGLMVDNKREVRMIAPSCSRSTLT